MRGALVDLAWKAPEYDPSTRQLVGYELFRDDVSTRPPTRRTWKTMPPNMLEAPGLEILPHSEYGVQPIWRMASPQPPYVIAFGPARLAKDVAGPSIVMPPEERIHSLAWLQRQGAITSEEMDLAVERLLAANAPPAPEVKLAPEAKIPPAGEPSSGTKSRVFIAYAVVAVVLILLVVVGGPYAARLLFPRPAAVHISGSTPSASPSPSIQPTPSPTAKPVNLQSILIKPTDLRAGYVAGQPNSNPLCAACVPAQSSLTLVLQNTSLKRTIITATTAAPTVEDSRSVVRALTAFRSGQWTNGTGLGDESFLTTLSSGGRNSFYVVWRSGVITNEIELVAPAGTRTIQDAIALAKIQQARTAKALA